MIREPAITYPIALPELLAPAAVKPVTTLESFEWPVGGRTWNYNEVGASHAGMLPDFIENLRQFGLTLADLEPLYRSARGVVELWKNAREREVPGDRRHLRWVEQSPFDLMTFDYWDASRDVNDASGRPICRSRSGHQLGYILDNACRIIEPSALRDSQPAAGPIIAYHAGRCLAVKDGSTRRGESVSQQQCAGTGGQAWALRDLGHDELQVVNAGSQLCLSVEAARMAEGGRVVVDACGSAPNQVWKKERHGNTFRLIAKHGGLCLEVKDQSRKFGAPVQQSKCTGAANQHWTIDALREDDYERLYQADRHRVAWIASATAGFPIPVSADGTRPVCRSTSGEVVLGAVESGECSGQGRGGSPARSAHFEVLHQAR